MVSIPARFNPGAASTGGRRVAKLVARYIKVPRVSAKAAAAKLTLPHEPASHDRWVLLCTMAMLTSGWERVLADRRRQR